MLGAALGAGAWGLTPGAWAWALGLGAGAGGRGAEAGLGLGHNWENSA